MVSSWKSVYVLQLVTVPPWLKKTKYSVWNLVSVTYWSVKMAIKWPVSSSHGVLCNSVSTLLATVVAWRPACLSSIYMIFPFSISFVVLFAHFLKYDSEQQHKPLKGLRLSCRSESMIRVGEVLGSNPGQALSFGAPVVQLEESSTGQKAGWHHTNILLISPSPMCSCPSTVSQRISIYPSIYFRFFTGAYPSQHRARGRVHPEYL